MASISSLTVLPSVIGAFILYWILLAIYRVFFHPLANYPGPLGATLTDWYMVYMSMTAQNTYKRYKLHMKYGKVVRVGANELSYSDEESIKDIFGQSMEPRLKLTVFYKGFSLTGRESVFSTTDRNEHGRMRRLLSHGFLPTKRSRLPARDLSNHRTVHHQYRQGQTARRAP
jgi:cytochrome P450